eukprot:7533924-Lingulodinium_polyedra.AAC.1
MWAITARKSLTGCSAVRALPASAMRTVSWVVQDAAFCEPTESHTPNPKGGACRTQYPRTRLRP